MRGATFSGEAVWRGKVAVQREPCTAPYLLSEPVPEAQDGDAGGFSGLPRGITNRWENDGTCVIESRLRCDAYYRFIQRYRLTPIVHLDSQQKAYFVHVGISQQSASVIRQTLDGRYLCSTCHLPVTREAGGSWFRRLRAVVSRGQRLQQVCSLVPSRRGYSADKT